MDYHVIIIGGSFAGLTAASQLARARRRVLIIDAGQPRNRFATAVHGFFGQDGIPPFEAREVAMNQLAAYPTVTFVEGFAHQAKAVADGFQVGLEDGRRYDAARLILAHGVTDQLPDIPGLKERWGQTVLHCPYCHGYEVADQPLGVLANHELSVHQAQLLPDWGPTTYFSQGVFNPSEEDREALERRDIQLETSPVVALLGEAPELTGVRLEDGRELPIHALFTAPKAGFTGNLAVDLGCELEEGPLGPYIRVDEQGQTSVPGVFAAGDAATAWHNATLAAAAGLTAGVSAHRSLVFG